MKAIPLFLLLAVSGCRAVTARAITPPPTVTPPIAADTPAPAPGESVHERRLRQQAQYIEALLSQNEALSGKLGSPGPAASPGLANAVHLPAETAATARVTKPDEPSALTPNPDGVIDVAAAIVSPKAGETANPFAVRLVPADSVREVSLQVVGIVAGPVACAVINDKLLQEGDVIESLTVERIETDGVVLRHGSQRMRLPVGGKNLRLRLPL